MHPQALYDLSPSASLLLLASLIACLPALWVWQRHRGAPPQRRRMALVVLVLFMTFDLILVGAFTRLTDSGLGCPDWPGCYGQSSPLSAHAEISAAQQAMPTGPVSHQKAWIEMAHRYLASGVGALILLMSLIAWRDHWLRHQQAVQQGPAAPGPWLPTLMLFWVIVQGLFGALTVTMKLFPAIVTLHLLGAYALLAMLVVQVLRWEWWHQDASSIAPLLPQKPQIAALPAMAVPLARAALLVLVLQAATGAWVSTNYAVLVCGEFPKCQGAWWPAMDFASALEIWRPLGAHADGRMVSFQALTAIHMGHRLWALLTVLLLTVLVLRFRKFSAWQRPLQVLSALLLLQVATGLSNVVLEWPLAAAVLHTGGAGALVAVLVWLLALASRHRRGEEKAASLPLTVAPDKQRQGVAA